MPTSSWTVGKGGACECAQPWAWCWVRRCRRDFSGQFVHYNRAGHGAVISPQTQWGYTVIARTKISRTIGDSGIHVGTMSFGKMEGDDSDKNIAFMLQVDVADGSYYHQYREGMKQTTPIFSGGVCVVFAGCLREPRPFQRHLDRWWRYFRSQGTFAGCNILPSG